MNEVNKINLGRQVFTIAVDAQHELNDYLNDIKKAVSDLEVVEEVEIRMAELLTARGISTDKVVLKKDIEHIKQQLGSPRDFSDDLESDNKTENSSYSVGKRLFRDRDNALIAGVAAGLASYFGLDVTIVRVLFIILLFITFGWGILIYILFWLLVPEAKTASDKLEMAGKPVTVEALKQVAVSDDVKRSTGRLNSNLADLINRTFAILLKIASVLMIIFGLSIIFGLLGWLVYFLANSATWPQYNIFPLGTTQHVLLYLAMTTTALGAIFLIIFGLALFRKKWPIGSWLTGTLIGLTLIGIATCGALGAAVYPNVRDTYNANLHTTTRNLSSFNNVNFVGDNVRDINFAYSGSYYVTINYFGNPDLSNLKTTVNGQTLTLDSSGFQDQRNCRILCVPPSYDVIVTIHSPNANQLQYPTNMPGAPYWGPYGPKIMRHWSN